MHLSSVLSLAGSFALANAHFHLLYPQTRGFDEPQEVNICGGFPLSPNRSQFPLSSGIVSISSEHPMADIDILISFDSNPTTFGQFNKTSTGTPIPFLLPFTVMHAQGDACFPVNVSSLGLPEAQNGVNATIMVQFNGGDGELYQCSDVILSNTFTVPSSAQCDNATGAFPTSSGASASSSSSSSSATSPAASHSSSASSVSPAMIWISTIGVMGLFVLRLN